MQKLVGQRLRLKYGPQLVSGKLHGQLEPVAWLHSGSAKVEIRHVFGDNFLSGK